MNKDEGAYKLNNIYDQLILKRQPMSDDVTSTANKWDGRGSVQNRVNKVPERDWNISIHAICEYQKILDLISENF